MRLALNNFRDNGIIINLWSPLHFLHIEKIIE